MIAPFLIEQAELAIAGADADPDATAGDERGRTGAENLDVGLRARLVAPKRRFVSDDGKQCATPDRTIGARVHGDHDVILKPDLLGRDAQDLLPQQRARVEKAADIVESNPRLAAAGGKQ